MAPGAELRFDRSPMLQVPAAAAGMADPEQQPVPAAAEEEEEADVGPSLPPEGADGEEEEGADVGPAMPKPKKRKVGARAAGSCGASAPAAAAACSQNPFLRWALR